MAFYTLDWSSYGFASGEEPFQLYSASNTDYVVEAAFFWNGYYFPAGTTLRWVTAADPGDKGWWLGANDAFQSASYVLAGTRPKNPRGYVEF